MFIPIKALLPRTLQTILSPDWNRAECLNYIVYEHTNCYNAKNLYIHDVFFKWVVTARLENLNVLSIFKIVLIFLFQLEAGDLPLKTTPCILNTLPMF